jgi:hypothetical protein
MDAGNLIFELLIVGGVVGMFFMHRGGHAHGSNAGGGHAHGGQGNKSHDEKTKSP